jgi:hypothetical protein
VTRTEATRPVAAPIGVVVPASRFRTSAGAPAPERRRYSRGKLAGCTGDLLRQPWWLPGFDPERETDALLALEDALRTNEDSS